MIYKIDVWMDGWMGGQMIAGYIKVCLRAKSLHLCPTLCDPKVCSLPGSSVHDNSPGNNTGVGCLALLQGIFPHPGIELTVPAAPALQTGSSPAEPPGKLGYINI